MAQQTSQVEINIGSKLDAKGFKQAETALGKMGKSAKNLAAAFGITFAAKQLISYTKAAANAAAQDQKSQALLANSLNNLGLAYAKVDVEGFISSLEAQTNIADDILRPSFAQLAQVTGSVTKAQDLMKLAFDASAGSGLDYSQTIDILSKAYTGNRKGLKELYLGLSDAELKSMSFQEIQKKIQATFAGAGGKSVETYQGQMDKLAISTGNASEKIGYALLNAVVKISGSGTIDGFTAKIDALATSFANLITQISDYIAISTGQQARAAFAPERVVAGGRIVFKNPSTGAGNLQLTGGSNMDTQRSQIALAKKAEKLAKDRNALLAIDNSLMTRKLVLTADQQALEELKKKFDIDRIQINAALNGNIDKETELRLRSLMAIHDNDEALAGKIMAEIAATKAITQLGDAARQAALKLQTSYSAGLSSFQQSEINSLTQGPAAVIPPSITQPMPVIPQSPLQSFRQNEAQYAGSGGVTIQINPAVAGLIDVIQNQSASGISPTVSRINTSYIA
jgi:hypothetical protein